MVGYFFVLLPKPWNDSENIPDIPYMIGEGVIGILAVIASLIVLIIFYLERHRLDETRYSYIISLTVADFIFALIGLPLYILVSIGWPPNLIGCLISHAILVSSGLISVFSIVAATVDKFWAVLYPYHYLNNATSQRANCKYMFENMKMSHCCIIYQTLHLYKYTARAAERFCEPFFTVLGFLGVW